MNASGVKRLIEAWQKDCSNDTQSDPIDFQSAGLSTDVITESTSGSGVKIDIMKILDRGIDTSSAGTLTVGAATATGVQIGASDITTTINGVCATTNFTYNASVARTATADGTGTGTIAATGMLQLVTVTSSNANHIIVLPTPTPGTIVILKNGATGYELRTSAPATVSLNGGVGANAESAIAANTMVIAVCTSATTWQAIGVAGAVCAAVEAAAAG